MADRVLIVQEMLTHYRKPFFDGLRDRLRPAGVELDLAHGTPDPQRAQRDDRSDLPWAHRFDNRYLSPPFVHATAVWQPVVRLAADSDLVVVEHANRHLTNYALLARSLLPSGTPVALWGHGGDLQTSHAGRPAEAVRSWTGRLPHWWFAYTEGAARRVVDMGFPADRISVVQNAVDTQEYDRFTGGGAPHRCVYLGSLHQPKRIHFLLEAARHLAARLPDFRLDVVGDGEQRHLVQRAADEHPWLHFPGALRGEAKARAVQDASLMLMPGMVGLAVLDSFASQTPMVSTAIDFHSPEFEYVRPGENSLVLPAHASPLEFAESTAALLDDPVRLEHLRRGCSSSATRYTLERMVENYATGVLDALHAPRRRPRLV